MVLFVFVIMMLNLGQKTVQQERSWLTPGIWFGPAGLSLVLLAELVYMFIQDPATPAGRVVGFKEVGIALFGPYLLAVELASILLLAGLVGAYHLAASVGRTQKTRKQL